MIYYYGIVEDRNDPLEIGRVRVRVHGLHPHQKDRLSTADLAWSNVIMPVTTAGLGGLGKTHSLVEGTSVIGFFSDNMTKQDFVVTGVSQGISQDGFIENEKGVLTENSTEFGFNDPRLRSSADYKDTTEDKTPRHAPERAVGLEHGLDYYPHIPHKLEIDYGKSRFASKASAKTKTTTLSKGVKITEPKEKDKELPYYPLDKNITDISKFERNRFRSENESRGTFHRREPLHRDLSSVFKDKTSDEDKFNQIGEFSRLQNLEGQERKDAEARLSHTGHSALTHANPQYPFNHATYTESGHLFELDDTRGFERVSLQHRSGTYFEWQPNGDSHQRVVRDSYYVVCRDQEMYVGGNVNIKILGDAHLDCEGDLTADVKGKADITSAKDLSLLSPVGVDIIGKFIKLNS